MALDVGTFITELLYEQDKVTVPGLGGFVKVYQPAVVDHVQEQIFPPTEEVKFNPNLAMDDGLLVRKLVEKLHLTVEEAEQEVRDFVKELKEAADRREIIVLPGIGRLYRSGESQLNLLSDHQNFSAGLFGLAPAKARPVAKVEFIPTGNIPSTGQNTAPKPKNQFLPARFTEWANQHLWVVLGLAVVVLLATAWFLFREPPSQLPPPLPPPEDRLNVSPSEPLEVEPGTETDPSAGIPDENQDAGQIAAEEDDETEAPTASPGQKECRIQIGLFGNEDNVKKLVRKIYDEGFEPYTEAQGKVTAVGIQFAYETSSEIDRNLKIVRSKFEKGAKIVAR